VYIIIIMFVFFQSIVIGPGGRTVQAITAEAKADIEALLGCPVDLTLNVRSQK
jgi:GTPase Era involved in 16S rRNA processing